MSGVYPTANELLYTYGNIDGAIKHTHEQIEIYEDKKFLPNDVIFWENMLSFLINLKESDND